MGPRAPLPAGDAWLAWLGHASLLLRLGGRAVVIDPVLSERILGAGQRFTHRVRIGSRRWTCC